MTPLTPLSAARARTAAWCVNVADTLTAGSVTRRLEEADRTAGDRAILERTVARVIGQRNEAREAAEDAWAARDRARSELSTAREDLARIGRLLADRHLIGRVGGPHLVRGAVEAALGGDQPRHDGSVGSVADTVATAIAGWTGTPGKAGLLEGECHELGWVAAAAMSGYLQPEPVETAQVQG